MNEGFDISRMNETDVREEILAPLLRMLGYRRGTEAAILTEQTLRYPRSFIGRKKNSDPLLKGRADYILEYKSRWRWVLEAKPGGHDISIDDIEQAYSYAVHPEICAIYYAVSNGERFDVYRSTSAPGQPPILSINLGDLNSEFTRISNVLSPVALERDWKDFVLDVGRPIAEGLRSFAKVEHGWVEHTAVRADMLSQEQIAHMIGMRVHIDSGVIQREGDLIRAVLNVSQGFSPIQAAMEQIGIKDIDVSSSDAVLSRDSRVPSIFEGERDFVIPAGQNLYDFRTAKNYAAPIAFEVFVRNTVKASLAGDSVSGSFRAEMRLVPGASPYFRLPQVNLEIEGNFWVRLNF